MPYDPPQHRTYAVCLFSLVTYLVVAADLASPLEEFPTTVSHLGKRPQPDPTGENLVENDVGPSFDPGRRADFG